MVNNQFSASMDPTSNKVWISRKYSIMGVNSLKLNNDNQSDFCSQNRYKPIQRVYGLNHHACPPRMAISSIEVCENLRHSGFLTMYSFIVSACYCYYNLQNKVIDTCRDSHPRLPEWEADILPLRICPSINSCF